MPNMDRTARYQDYLDLEEEAETHYLARKPRAPDYEDMPQFNQTNGIAMDFADQLFRTSDLGAN